MRRQLAVNLGACALLLIQYLLGMVVNVYVVLPSRHPGAGASDYFPVRPRGTLTFGMGQG
jgi:hypothetical protein